MTNEWNVDASEIAENYERFLVPTIFKPSAEALLAAVQPKQGESVVDVACGTGIVARLAAERVGERGHVVGVDMLPDMLAVARAADKHIRWEQAGADKLPLEDDTFDVVTCQQGLQFFPDKAAALGEMRRVAAPGGRLGIAVLAEMSRTPALEALADAFEKHIGPAPAQFVRMVGAMGDREQLQSLIEGAGFGEVKVRDVSVDITFDSPEAFVREYLISTPLAANPAVSQADSEVIGKVESEFASALAKQGGGSTFPAVSYIATARA